MHPELEALLKAWDAYLQELEGPEAERRLLLYESKLDDYCARSKVSKELLQRAVESAHRRWQWASDPKFPRDLRKIRLD